MGGLIAEEQQLKSWLENSSGENIQNRVWEGRRTVKTKEIVRVMEMRTCISQVIEVTKMRKRQMK